MTAKRSKRQAAKKKTRGENEESDVLDVQSAKVFLLSHPDLTANGAFRQTSLFLLSHSINRYGVDISPSVIKID